MAHTLLVTVTEFLANGGCLARGRQFYDSNRTPKGWYYDADLDNKDYVIVETQSARYPMSGNLIYVEIPAIPTYE